MRWVSAWSMAATATVVLLGLGCASDSDPGTQPSEISSVSPTAEPGSAAAIPTEAAEQSGDLQVPQLPEAAEATPPAIDDEAAAGASVSPAPAPAVPPAVRPAATPPPAAAVERVPRVALVQFTTSVEEREPMDAVTFLGNDAGQILFYTDLRDLAGSTVLHRWEYQGEVVSEVPFEVRGDRWRVWSRKSLEPAQIGDWTVSVVAPDGEVLAVETFSYQEAR